VEAIMPSLHLRGLSYAHTAAASVLTDADLDLAADRSAHGTSWIGVVGANGAGKTTLLRLLAGELTPERGHLDVQASSPPRLVPQRVDALTDDVLAFAWTWDGHAERLRRWLGLDPDDLLDDRGWPALSPGQRKRWQVAAALTERPDVLLLDEPTNHLDGDARELLLAALVAFEGLGLVVSHDRQVLEHLTSRTLRLHAGRLELHAGAYGTASTRWRVDEATLRADHERAVREARRQRRILGEVRRDRHSAEVGPRRRRRTAGAAEPDAREAGRKFAQRKAEAALARRVTQLNARVARAEGTLAAAGEGLERDHAGTVGFRHDSSGRPVLAAVAGTVPHAGGAPWLHDVDVVLHRGDRVHLTGRNGAGKSTLLRCVRDQLEHAGETVGALPQELDAPPAEVARVCDLDPVTRGRILGTAARLGIDPGRVLVTDDPSPGEARKLALARLLVDDVAVLVLDEPTNHLDLPSIERLEEALRGWPGALLLVSHDDALAAAVTTVRWQVAERTVRVSRGTPDARR
jgi:ATPase subunit of ABC transporter with duplicated ATPase domains